MTRRSDAGEARNRGPLVSSSQCLNTKCGQSKRFGTGPGRVRVQTFLPNTQLPPIGIRAKIWAYTWCQKSFAIQMPKLRKRAIHILSLLKKGGLYLAALKKGGGYSGAYPYYVLHRELPTPPPPPTENVVRGDQKLCKRSPYNASLKLSKTYVKY